MSQNPGERPIPSLQRKAAIAYGAALDHQGSVAVRPIPNFDLNRTIFNTLEGKLPRFIMQSRIAKEAHWSERSAQKIEADYKAVEAKSKLPKIDPQLLRFLVEECNFDVEHADGSFLDHLYYCFEYSVVHYPQQSALVMLLHSILGTGTNTFAMGAEKIPQLRKLLNDFDWRHIEAFPSILRLLYDGRLRSELRDNLHRIGSLKAIRFHRVIDNQPLELSAEDLFIQLNYQLIHVVDFLPVSSWARNASDTSFILFRDLYDLLERMGKRQANVKYTPTTARWRDGDYQGAGALLTALIPVSVAEKMASRSVRRFSEQIGHNIDYTLVW